MGYGKKQQGASHGCLAHEQSRASKGLVHLPHPKEHRRNDTHGMSKERSTIMDIDHFFHQLLPSIERGLPPVLSLIWTLAGQLLLTLFKLLLESQVRRWLSAREAHGNNLSIRNRVEGVMAHNRHQSQLKTL
jgi:hypothetical protein